jgi:hypothetical protein
MAVTVARPAGVRSRFRAREDDDVPSYRVTLAVGLLQPGVDPASVLPAAADAARGLTKVEAQDVAVVAGEARVVVRYLALGDTGARTVGDRVADQVRALAEVRRVGVDRRDGPRWTPVDGRRGQPRAR